MSKVIPVISSGIAGPIGVLHLPRLWHKASLGAAGKLHDDYPAIGAGYDQMVLDGLGISKEAFSEFIAAKKPTYPECEAWVLEQKGGKLDQAAVDLAHSVGDDQDLLEKRADNDDSYLGFEVDAEHRDHQRTEATRKAILGANNIKDEGKILDAVNLNNLDDWLSFHKEVILG